MEQGDHCSGEERGGRYSQKEELSALQHLEYAVEEGDRYCQEAVKGDHWF